MQFISRLGGVLRLSAYSTVFALLFCRSRMAQLLCSLGTRCANRVRNPFDTLPAPLHVLSLGLMVFCAGLGANSDLCCRTACITF